MTYWPRLYGVAACIVVVAFMLAFHQKDEWQNGNMIGDKPTFLCLGNPKYHDSACNK